MTDTAHNAQGKVRSDLLLVFAGVVLGMALLSWLYLQADRVSAQQHLQYTEVLRDLRELNSRADGEMLANQLDQVRNYDTLTHYIQRLELSAQAALHTPDYLTPQDQAQVLAAAQALQKSLAQKAELMDRFKRDNAVLRNSLSYFPIAAAELLDAEQNRAMPPTARAMAGHYIRQVYAIAQQQGSAGTEAVLLAQQELNSKELQASPQWPQVHNLQVHGDHIVASMRQISDLMHEVAELGSNEKIEDLNNRYAAGYDRALSHARRFQTALFCLAVLLTTYMARLFVRLDSTRRNLARANQEISARLQAQLEAEKQLQLHATAFRSGHDGITLTDASGTIVDVNPAFTRITGWERDEVVGHNPRLLKSGVQDESFYAAMWQSIRENGSWKGEIWNRNKSGDIYPELLSISAVRGANGEVSNYVAVFSDIGPIKKQESQLKQMAYFDALTGLPNRVLLVDRLLQGMAQSRRAKTLMAVCYLDLDGFKAINDTLGHDQGDRVLVEMGRRVASVLRGGDTVARLGGDEFVVLLMGLADATECREAVARMLDQIAMPLTMLPGSPHVSASVGATLFPLDDENPDTLLRHADQAMYRSKLAGKNMLSLFDTEEDRSSRSHHDRLARMRQALDEGELLLYYQPKVDMRRGRVTGMEALLRWQHPEHGLLGPMEFLPPIENDDLIVDIGDWVMRQALQQINAWNAAGLRLQVSVNVAARQLQADNFSDKLAQAQAHCPDCLQQLELEILETAALEDMVKTARVIEECRALGVGFALDDFGTGYSSLTYLRRLPVKTLKIDQSFVREILNDPSNQLIVQAVIGLANAFQLHVIAEGVESVAHGRLLLQLECDHAQGYGISRPMPGAAVADWVRDWRADPSWAS